MARNHFEGDTSLRRTKKREVQEEVKGVPTSRWHRSIDARIVEAFVLKYLHHKYDNPLPTPPFHREIWTACTDTTKPYVEVLAPRGHAKSTSITEAYGLTSLLFRQRDFALILSNTYTQSAEFLADILTEFEENDDLRADFGLHKILRGSEDNVEIKFKDGHKIRIVAKGAEQKVRGVKWNKRRPNLILCDDLEDDEQVENSERRKKFRKWFFRAVLPFGSDDALFRVGATILHFDSLAENISKDKWEAVTNPEGWFTLRYRAHQGFDDFTNILWPEKFPESRLRGIRSKYIKVNDKDGYSQEYLNIPIAEGEGMFRAEDLITMEDVDYLRPMRKYAAWDFAIETKQTSDYTCCVVIGVDDRGKVYVIDVRRGRWDSKGIIDEMFNVHKAHACLCHYAEAGHIEKAIGPFLYDEMRRRADKGEDAYFNVEPRWPTKDKVTRSTSWRAATRARNIKYDKKASWWPALEEEMLRFPKGENDDQVDPQSLLGLELHNLIAALSPEEAANEEYEQEFGKDTKPQGRNRTTGY